MTNDCQTVRRSRTCAGRLATRFAAAAVVLLAACGDDPAASNDVPDRGVRADATDAAADVDVAADPATDESTDVGADDATDGSGVDDPAPDDVGPPDVDAGGEDAADLGPARPTESVVTPGAESVETAFGGREAAAASGTMAVVYPVDETRMPRNIPPATFQWTGGEGGAGYRLRIFTSQRVWDVFTTDWKWRPTQLQWERLIADSRGEDLVISVASVDRSGAITGSDGVRLRFSSASVDGAVYYWTPSQSGIVRLPAGAEEPEPFLSGTVFNCVGCHALSPDGSRLAYTRSSGGTPVGTLGVVGTDDSRTQYVREGTLGLYYPSFSPDNVRLAAGRGGEIVVLNTDSGEIEESLPRPAGTSGSFPSWSPADTAVVFAAGPAGVMDSLGVSNSGLAITRRVGGRWGDAEWLVEQGDAGGLPESLFYPAFSPTGRWIVFNRSQSGAAVGGSPADSELWLVGVSGGAPLRLDAANGPAGTTNSWPRWAPESGDGTLWIAFTSNRPYGRLGGGGTPQIWIAAVEPTRAAPGFDPSWPAFWLPGQQLTVSNHVAYWAEYVKE